MPTTASTIYRDSLNFYKNELRSLITLSAFLAVVLAIITSLVGPNNEEYQLMLQFIADFKQTELSSASPVELEAMSNNVVGVAKKVLVLYAFETLLQSVLVLTLLMFVMAISSGQNVSIAQSFTTGLPRLPKMFLLILICSILISMGFMVMIIPGLILLIGFALAPVALMRQNNIGSAIRYGWKIGFGESKLLIPALGIWILMQFGIGFLTNITMQLPDFVHNFLFYLLKNMASVWMIIYLFRLFMLVNDKYAAQQR